MCMGLVVVAMEEAVVEITNGIVNILTVVNAIILSRLVRIFTESHQHMRLMLLSKNCVTPFILSHRISSFGVTLTPNALTTSVDMVQFLKVS